MTFAVVGAGPSGLLAAILLARHGENVRLIDEQSALGGHLTYDRYAVGRAGPTSADLFQELETAVVRSGASVRLNAVVWGAFRTDSGFDLTGKHQGGLESVACDRVVFATGTTDRAISVPGSTLPGVMTARAARLLGERHGVVPGERFAVVGDGAHAQRLAGDITGWGARVEAITGADSVRRIAGTDCVDAIETTDGVFDVDVVVFAAGEHPDVQLPGMLGVERSFNSTLGWWQVRNGAEGVAVVGGAALGGADIGHVLQSAVDLATNVLGMPEWKDFTDLPTVGSLLAARWDEPR